MSSEKIEKLRKKINSVDDRLVELLDERARLAKEIGKIKKGMNADIVSFERHVQVLERAKKKIKYLASRSVENIFREIISASLASEAKITVGFLGPKGTFSELAAQRLFGSSVELVAYGSIAEVFDAVEREEATYGVVPIENSSEGSVMSTLDLLLASNLLIKGETMLKINHNLLAMEHVKEKDIKTVYAHEQALAQCKLYLSRKLPNAEKRAVSSNARACELVDSHSAAIAGDAASGIYGLRILERNIQDSAKNTTRFIVLGSSDSGPTGRDKTSIAFSLKDRPGSLYNALRAFKNNGINLTKIESRPSKQKSWEYVFYVDFLGHRKDSKCISALENLGKQAVFLKILGSYPTSS